MNPIAKMVAKIRERLRESQEQFAERLKIQQTTVSRYESGKSVPRPPVLMQLYALALPAERRALTEALGRQWVAVESAAEKGALSGWEPVSQERAGWEPVGFDRRTLSKSLAPIRMAKKTPNKTEDPITEIHALWAQYGSDPRAVEFFRDAAAYLRVQLSGLKRGRKL